jgi:hypothetical protein
VPPEDSFLAARFFGRQRQEPEPLKVIYHNFNIKNTGGK